MGATNTHHRPLVSGIEIKSGRRVNGNLLTVGGGGTLTGLATRTSDGKKVLVTNQHVIAGTDDGAFRDLVGDEEMYQDSVQTMEMVGSLLDSVPIVSGDNNTADVAICELLPLVAAEFALHDHPIHSNRRIIKGMREPQVGDSLTMMGAVSGERTATVMKVGGMTTGLSRNFTGVVELDFGRGQISPGDSGSACLFKVGDGEYQMSCIAFASRGLLGESAWAFPASVAERELGITFGCSPPGANAGPNQTVDTGSIVTLDGSGSTGDGLTYLWEEQVIGLPGPVGTLVSIQDPTSATPSFTAPSSATTLVFRVTVTDVCGAAAADTVFITVRTPNLGATANAGSDRVVAPDESVTLDGSASSDPNGDALTYSWEQMSGPSVTLSSATAVSPTFTAPASAATLTFRLTVTDSGGLSHSDDVIISVSNRWPWADAGLDQVVAPGATVTLDSSASFDRDGDMLTYCWEQTGGPSVSLSDATAASPTFMAPASAVLLAFQLTVADPGGLSHSDDVTISVPNLAPIANAGSDRVVAPNEAVALDGSASSDPNGDALSYRWVLIGGTIVSLSGITTASPTFTAPASAATVTLQLTVTDPGGLESSDDVIISVSNRWPVANAGLDQVVRPGALVTLDGSGRSDPDQDPLTHAWSQVSGTPVSLSDATVANPTFTASLSVGELVFRLTVTDPRGLEHSDEVVITVSNQSPMANAGSDQVVDAGATVTLDGSGSSDPDSDALTYRWEQTGGTSVTLSNTTVESPTFTAPSSAATLTFRLTVTDPGELSGTDEVTITVRQPNRAPTANAGSDQTVETGERVTLRGSGTDPDGDPLTYVWRQSSGSGVSLSFPVGSNPVFTAPSSAGTLVFELTVTDGRGGRATDEVTIMVRSPNPAPTANAGSDQTVETGASVILSGSGSSDPDDDLLTYSWEQTGGTSVTLSNTTVESPTFTAPSSAATLTFRLTVTDPGELSDTDEVTITVHQPNRAPTANAGSDQTVETGERVTLRGSGTDPDGDPLTYVWRQSSGTGVSLSFPVGSNPVFTAPSSAGTLVFELTVTDGQGGRDTDTVTITVQAPETWGSWSRTGRTQGSCQSRTAEEARTSSYGNTETRWVSAPERVWFGPWTRTGRTQGSCQSRTAEEARTSNCSSRQTRWVSDPEQETWGPWTRTGSTQGSCQSRTAEEARTSNCSSRQTRWVSDPEQETWGPWTRTGSTQGSCQSRTAEEARTSNCSSRQTRWVSDPEQETWGPWTPTGNRVGPPIFEAEEARTSNCGNRETRWVSDL